MQLLSWLTGRKKPQQQMVVPNSDQCSHPISFHLTLREDPDAPRKVTGVKCTRCGERLPDAE